MNMLGDMNKYTQFQVAQSLPIAAANEGNGGMAGIGVGLGAGLTMANSMMNAMKPGATTPGEQPPPSAGPAASAGPVAPGGPAAAPPAAPGAPAAETKFCTNCGNKMGRSAKFCPECGTAQ
jgi:membrane protease subunit (stomatin/prohibitin family)